MPASCLRRLVVALSLCLATTAKAQTAPTPTPTTTPQTGFELHAARALTNEGLPLMVGAGLLAPALEDHALAGNHVRQTVLALGGVGLVTEALKRLTREPRPNAPQERDSFPSGHASVSFTVAALQAAYHPHQAGVWYAAATLISLSRIALHRHRWQDVAAGAAIGLLGGRWAAHHSRSEADAPRAGLAPPAPAVQLLRTF